MPKTSLRRIYRVVHVTRSTLYGVDTEEAPVDETKPVASEPSQDELLVARIKLLIETSEWFDKRGALHPGRDTRLRSWLAS